MRTAMEYCHVGLWALAMLGYSMAASATTCQTDADCSVSQRCVSHANFSSSGNCQTDRRCIDASGATCSCSPGYECRMRGCLSAQYEWKKHINGSLCARKLQDCGFSGIEVETKTPQVLRSES
ncbi:uncharacterized protein [Dermacentor andersoni]|uniref:uncharacterized protein n=1 Tax=Dermacentor andersoni TaxID=34620 RepID=UPI002417D87B|nr:uncharacterized protein LOC129385532 [Dermacentor andersoni]